MTRKTEIQERFWLPKRQVLGALGLALLLVFAGSHFSAAEAKSKRQQLNRFAAPVVLANLPAARFVAPSLDQPARPLGALPLGTPPASRADDTPVWLASNVDSAYLAGVRAGRFASLRTIKGAIQAFTGVAIKRVLSIAMNQGVLALTVEDVYSNIFTINVQPETAQILQ